MYRVLLPIDESRERAEAQARAVAALPGAEDVAVTVMHVYEDWSQDVDVLDLPSAGVVEDVLGDLPIETEQAFGDPSEEIVRVSREIGADAIVLGGRKRSSLGSLLFGSVSQSVTLHADRPVTITGSDVESEESDGPPGYGASE